MFTKSRVRGEASGNNPQWARGHRQASLSGVRLTGLQEETPTTTPTQGCGSLETIHRNCARQHTLSPNKTFNITSCHFPTAICCTGNSQLTKSVLCSFSDLSFVFVYFCFVLCFVLFCFGGCKNSTSFFQMNRYSRNCLLPFVKEKLCQYSFLPDLTQKQSS